MGADREVYVTAAGNEITDEIHAMRCPVMTDTEELLKEFRNRREDLHGRVLEPREMQDYVLWMAQTYGKRSGQSAGSLSIPPMLRSGGIPALGRQLLEKPDHKEALRSLADLYERSDESRFFLENQDIAAGIFLRYFPAYWQKSEYFEVYYCFSGNCPVFFENETVAMHPGTVLIIPPGTKKACTCLSDECRTMFFMIRKSTFSNVFWAHFSDHNLMSHFFRQALGQESCASYLYFDTGADIRIEWLLCTIYREYNREGKYTAGLLNSFMSAFFLLLLRNYEETASVSKQGNLYWKPQFAEILGYIQENFSAVSLEELSAKFHYSPRQLMRIIQACTGQNLRQLQNRLRMEKAARMLIAGNMPVSRIAAEIGFTDYTSFYRAFSRYYGCTPASVRRDNSRFF